MNSMNSGQDSQTGSNLRLNNIASTSFEGVSAQQSSAALFGEGRPLLISRNHQLPQAEEFKQPVEPPSQPQSQGNQQIFQNIAQRVHSTEAKENIQMDSLVLEGMQGDENAMDMELTNLSPRQAVMEKNQEFNAFFVCQICLKVLLDPVECKTCQTAFCSRCIQLYVSRSPQQNSATCPFRCQNTKYLPIHRFAKNQLIQQKFKCPYMPLQDTNGAKTQEDGHQDLLLYGEALKHLQNCPYRKALCQCGEQIQKIQLFEHLKTCTKARVYCKNCEMSYNYQREQHDCVSFLRDKFGEYKLLREKQENYEDKIFMKCPNGHSIYPQRGKTHWQNQYAFIFCDTCKVSDLSTHNCFWRCLHQCDFDLCHECLYKALPKQQPNNSLRIQNLENMVSRSSVGREYQ